ncbi:MAG TPA: HD domain-containing protein [Phycisphaerales bacterium]|nr:HD domain-containing protein [Phycisphaerales bacterium]
MGCLSEIAGKLIVDSIHGDIHLNPCEVRVIGTASFQRLRRLKQLAMAQMVYPNATHTRFAHSLGVLGMMVRIIQVAQENSIQLSHGEQEELRLAALLHDIGHYPYSHLMEKLDDVKLVEEFVQDRNRAEQAYQPDPYPDHEEVGQLIATSQRDLVEAIGGAERAKRVADLFARTQAADPELSKLVHSSLDLDRMDYLLRDSRATGVPYGCVDVNYLLNNLRVSPSKVVGFREKAVPAIEHLLLARFFMHRVVYFHKTTYGLEEICRQLLRRLRDRRSKDYPIPRNGAEVRKLVQDEKRLPEFVDAFVDEMVRKAVSDEDWTIQTLARCLVGRTPPKLLKEVLVYEEAPASRHEKPRSHAGELFRRECRSRLEGLAKDSEVDLRLFVWCKTKGCSVGDAVPQFDITEAATMPQEQIQAEAAEAGQKDIKVFIDDKTEPESILKVGYSLVKRLARYEFCAYRLYVVGQEDGKVAQLRQAVKDWAD